MKKLLLMPGLLLIATLCGANIILVPQDVPTIQEAIDLAHDYDTVLVDAGTYYENINFRGKSILVASHYIVAGDENIIRSTIIHSAQNGWSKVGSVVAFVTGEDTNSVLCGFTITGGQATAYRMWNFIGGGGIYIDGAGPKILHNIITKNTAASIASNVAGAGLCSRNLGNQVLILRGNIFQDNVASSINGDAFGGALYIDNEAIIEDNRIIGNSCSVTDFCNRMCAGAGVYITSPKLQYSVIFRNNTIINNRLTGYNCSGAGAFIKECCFDLTGNTFAQNQIVNGSSTSKGGAVCIDQPTGNFSITSNDFHNNQNLAGEGGAISVEGSWNSCLVIDNNYFIENAARNGGAVIARQVAITFVNDVFTDNGAVENAGALLLLSSNATPVEHTTVFINSSFFRNQANQLAGAIFSDFCNPVLLNCIFWEDNTAIMQNNIYLNNGDLYIAHSLIDTACILGPFNTDNFVICSDPCYSNGPSLIPLEYSPCINSGTSMLCLNGSMYQAPTSDILGTQRPLLGEWDLGAYEMQQCMNPQISKQSPIGGISPNRYSEKALMRYSLDEAWPVSIRIMSLDGKLVKELVNPGLPAEELTTIIEGLDLPTGFYVYTIQTKKKAVTGKLQKMR